ncbi:MAG: molybdopterin-binding protein, partial [Asticcacaulis sp.]
MKLSETDLKYIGAGRLHEDRPFIPVNIAVLTVSDSRTRDNDTSGDVLARRIEAAGHHLAAREIVRDDKAQIRTVITNWIDSERVDVIISTGGTGITGRDVT